MLCVSVAIYVPKQPILLSSQKGFYHFLHIQVRRYENGISEVVRTI